MKAKRSSASNHLGILWGSVSSHLFAIALRNVQSWLSCHSKACSLAEVFSVAASPMWIVEHFPSPADMLVNTVWFYCHFLWWKVVNLFPSPSSAISHLFGIFGQWSGGPRRSFFGSPLTASSHQDLSEPLSAACWYWVQAQGHQVFPLLFIFTEALSCSPLMRSQHF